MSIRERLIVALDLETAREAREMFARLRASAVMFKIGSQLFTAAGPAIVREMVEEGARIFLDLKFHDIPNTVARAGIEAARLGVSIFNVHALGGREMMQRTREAVAEASEREGLKPPSIIAVTALTSADDAALEEVGIPEGAAALVTRLARLAWECGLDGVVASPVEVTLVRDAIHTDGFLIVTPGVRPAGFAADDQKRFTTPAQAMRAGADYLVVGRAILRAPDPLSEVERIVEEMERASTEKSESFQG
ncbi:MAG TPA: orotidine-5'-phosphate decarboxylase [Pyrinomonadaceae bacterium]